MLYILGFIFAPWFALTYFVVDSIEKLGGTQLYQWPDGSIKRYGWSSKSNPEAQGFIEAKDKKRWGDDQVDMTKIRQINRYF